MSTKPPPIGTILAERAYGADRRFELFEVVRDRGHFATIATGYAPEVGLFDAFSVSGRGRPGSADRVEPTTRVRAASPSSAKVFELTVAGSADNKAALARILDREALPRLALLLETEEAAI